MTEESTLFWQSTKRIFIKVSNLYDQRWRKRKRIIDTQFLLLFIFKLVLSKNKQGYGSVLVDLWDDYAQKGIAPPTEKAVSASSICEARQKLSESVFIDINKELILSFEQHHDTPEWNGHRVFGIDGSRINLPSELGLKGYKPWNKKLHHYPHGLMSCLYRLSTGIVYDFVISNKYNEREHALSHLHVLRTNDVVVFDRGYFSYLLLYKYIEQGALGPKGWHGMRQTIDG